MNEQEATERIDETIERYRSIQVGSIYETQYTKGSVLKSEVWEVGAELKIMLNDTHVATGKVLEADTTQVKFEITEVHV